MSKTKLSLRQPDDDAAPPPPSRGAAPIAGYLAVGLGLAGIFTAGYIFVPLAFLASVIALFSRQIIWGIFGILLSFAGLLTSPVLLALIGIAWLASIVGI